MPNLKRKDGSLKSAKNDPDTESTNAKSPSGKKAEKELIHLKVRLLDEAQAPLEFYISKTDTGATLFASICEKLGGIIERDYFGLRYTDKHNQRQWLELDKSVYKQLKDSKIFGLSFRVKHYPEDPLKDFKQEIARYLLYLQIRRDMVQGRLLGTMADLQILGALVVQAEYGDAPIDQNKSYDDKIDAEQRRSSQLSGASLTSSLLNSGEGSRNQETVRQFMSRVRVIFNQTDRAVDEIVRTHLTFR